MTGHGYWSRPARALWIEIILVVAYAFSPSRSRPARALWIEIADQEKVCLFHGVEAREGLVD